LLNEIIRVAKDVIIVYESPADGIFYRIMCYFHGISFARFFRKIQRKEVFYHSRMEEYFSE